MGYYRRCTMCCINRVHATDLMPLYRWLINTCRSRIRSHHNMHSNLLLIITIPMTRMSILRSTTRSPEKVPETRGQSTAEMLYRNDPDTKPDLASMLNGNLFKLV
jgi:hypothetical protein